MRPAVAFAAFQAGWFASTLGAVNGMAWLGPSVVGALAAVVVARGSNPRRAALLLAASGALGFLLDSVLTAAGLLRFPFGGNTVLSPLWMAALWVNFALFIPAGLSWLYGRPALAAALGAAGGPAAYWAGQRLGAIEWSSPLSGWAIAAEWAAATPALCWLASRARGEGASA